MPFAESFAELQQARIHYDLSELAGAADKPVLVFSNSLGANLSMWQPQLAALTPHFRILRYDTRGHGQSSVPTGPYTVTDLGQDVLGLLDSLSIDKVSFCGLSMGGIIGQWLAVHAAKRLQKLILANTAAKIGTAETWNMRIPIALQQGLSPIIPGTLERWFTPTFHARHPATIASTAAMLHGTSPQGYAHCCAAIRDADFRVSIQLMQMIQTPTLVITGAHDPVTTLADGHFLADNIPGSTYAELPAAHLSNIEAAAEFNQALHAFLIQ